MNLKQACGLKPGDRVRTMVAVPNGADPYGRPGYIPGEGYQHDPIPAGQVLIFHKLIPKVCVRNHEPWQDGHVEMLFCEMQAGQRAWLNIGNAERA